MGWFVYILPQLVTQKAPAMAVRTVMTKLMMFFNVSFFIMVYFFLMVNVFFEENFQELRELRSYDITLHRRLYSRCQKGCCLCRLMDCCQSRRMG